MRGSLKPIADFRAELAALARKAVKPGPRKLVDHRTVNLLDAIKARQPRLG